MLAITGPLLILLPISFKNSSHANVVFVLYPKIAMFWDHLNNKNACLFFKTTQLESQPSRYILFD